MDSSQSQQQSTNIGSSTGSGSIGAESLSSEGSPPLWRFVTRIEKQGAVGGTWKYRCNFCNENRTSSYSRVRAHLLQIKGQGIACCKKVSRADKLEMQKLDDEFENKKLDSGPREVPLPSESLSHLDSDAMFKKRNPHYMRSYTFAATHNIAGYKPPGYNKLRTTLLVQEKANVENLMIPLKSTWREKGVTIVTDGWSDPTRKPLINFMATSGNGPIFLKAVNCFGEIKDKYFNANLMKEVIQEVGHQNVVQVITDNAANCKGAGELIEKCSWITDIHGDAMVIKNFIMNHNMRLAIFQKFSPLKFLSVADTRFASIIVMLKRFKLIKRGLQAMVISDEWTSYREEDMGKANFVKDKIVNDDWWDKLAYIVDFTKPIYDMIRLCDTDKPCLHLVYEMWDSMIEQVKLEIYKKEGRPNSEFSPFYHVVYEILVARWAKSNTPLHCLAHSLNPRYYSDEWLLGDQSRIAPHRDGEVSRERMKCFRRLFALNDDVGKVMEEYAQFSMKSGPFEDLTCISRMHSMDPKSWWANFGAQTPLLQSLAFKVLGQPTSSSCSERNWSTYAFIHSLRRNKLNPSRAQDLVFIHNNLRLLSRNSEEYAELYTKMWNVGGDAFDSLEDVGFLEFAELSLDEPDLENVLLVED
ncbi:uncharacterized protein [Spinacia oleracea]|uniref:BED-type domain-containing protein n=1 Tax=Spinacia oleracea TaxID=3562 RepID=A0ABM3R9F4_SPIOL|nr:uncharacterized protein LOC130467675 [Spinacia oleracea]